MNAMNHHYIRTSHGMIERDFAPVTVDVTFEYQGRDYRVIGKFKEQHECFVSGTLLQLSEDGYGTDTIIDTPTVWDEANRVAQVDLAEQYAKEAAAW